MNTIQKWFERLAGITHDELERLRIAAEVFHGPTPFDASSLQTPACWRRNRRVLGN